MKFRIPTVYPITDTSIARLPMHEQVARFAAGGASFVQLREKHASSRDFYEAAAGAVSVARAKGVKVIVNDRVDIALLLKADGVHLGQDDLPPAEARRLLGEEAVIGYSTHTIDQAAAAIKLPIDYLAFGPIFPTRTKANPDPVVGLNLLPEVRSIAAKLPLVAIGGIDEHTIASVIDAGADSAAVIGAILSDPENIVSRLHRLTSLAGSRGLNSV